MRQGNPNTQNKIKKKLHDSIDYNLNFENIL